MWKDWFYFSRKEQNGIIVLIVLVIILLAIRLFLPDLTNREPFDYSMYITKIDSFRQALYDDSVRLQKLREDHFTNGAMQRFDPNTIDSSQMRALGFGTISINNISRYRQAGGTFRDADDLTRIYSISDSEAIVLKPFITITSHQAIDIKTKEKPPIKKRIDLSPKREPVIKRPVLVEIELNRADTAQLKQLYGIGDVFAQRLLKYREWLGGFHHLSQLKEVYGLPQETIDKLADRVNIDTLLIKKIAVNSATVNQLKSHPYLTFYQAKAIHDQRIRVKIHNFSQILKIEGIDTAGLRRIKPYLSFSDTGASE